MDNTNQTKQPLDQNALPNPLPPTPPVEDITPVSEPVVAPVAEPQVKNDWTLPPTPPVVPQPETPAFPVTASAPEPAFVPPQATPMDTPTVPEVTPVSQPSENQPMAETPMPSGKPKNKISPIVGGVVALLLVVGVAGAAYYVSNQLSTRQAVAPTAPESEPMAATGAMQYNEICEKNCSQSVKNCYEAIGSKTGKWKLRACGTTGCGPLAQRKVIIENSCNSSTGGIETQYYTKCEKTAACANQLVPVNENLPTEVTDKESEIITFDKVGWVSVAWSGKAKMTLTPVVSGTPVVIATDSAGLNVMNEVLEITTAGQQYKVTLRLDNEANDGYGFRSPLDLEETKCGPNDTTYGNQIDISGVKNSVSQNISLNDVSPSSIQCWGDSLVGDATQDYDFNDRTVFIGYESTSPPAGACTEIKVYKKVSGAYGTTPLTTAQLGSLTVGDVLKFSLTSNTDDLQGRFGVKVESGTTTWLNGTIDATNKKLVTYSDYTVAVAGAYQFEGQVSTTP